MRRSRAGAILTAGLVVTACLLVGGPARAAERAQAAGPVPCHWVGAATRPAERLSPSQHLIAMTVERDLSAGGAARAGEDSILLNSTYGATYYRGFDIKTGTPLEVFGYVRQGGQCVVDTLNVGTLEPGFEGYLRPPNACPTAGEETIAVSDKASASLGCAVAPMLTAPTAIQPFQGGAMLYLRGIYVLLDAPAALGTVPLAGGTWSGVRDTYREPEPPQLGLRPPAEDLIEPRLGFGKAWREQYGGPDGPLGWAVADEQTGDASWQLFERGIVVVTRDGQGFILYHEGRVWEQQRR
jgi:hypothetical protein